MPLTQRHPGRGGSVELMTQGGRPPGSRAGSAPPERLGWAMHVGERRAPNRYVTSRAKRDSGRQHAWRIYNRGGGRAARPLISFRRMMSAPGRGPVSGSWPGTLCGHGNRRPGPLERSQDTKPRLGGCSLPPPRWKPRMSFPSQGFQVFS